MLFKSERNEVDILVEKLKEENEELIRKYEEIKVKYTRI